MSNILLALNCVTTSNGHFDKLLPSVKQALAYSNRNYRFVYSNIYLIHYWFFKFKVNWLQKPFRSVPIQSWNIFNSISTVFISISLQRNSLGASSISKLALTCKPILSGCYLYKIDAILKRLVSLLSLHR